MQDVRRFLVTHVHGDHYSLASRVRSITGAETYLGEGERQSLRAITEADIDERMRQALRDAGAQTLADSWEPHELGTPDSWADPSAWIKDGHEIDLGNRTLLTVTTPGHTLGHCIFVDPSTALTFTGDHVLPRITPSVGFEAFIRDNPLRDYIRSLQRLLTRPDTRLLPAHGDPCDSTHARVSELLAHHESRLAETLAAAAGAGPSTPFEIAARLTWTRRRRSFTALGPNDASLATMETRAHLEALCDRLLVHKVSTDARDAYAVA
ncbi:MBL fold metallo-hydrolase [Aeromicrobium sp. PE09-221]|uniref:MBL fold metallo-hydrolase n=1 Tax=Aeromicrobium sp. PE09-221 TaxID=1898043 RepID=UPI001F1C3F7C|nr:MBL fold metallo-hydrolase [Aeromicrobium sp. PE09-221]